MWSVKDFQKKNLLRGLELVQGQLSIKLKQAVIQMLIWEKSLSSELVLLKDLAHQIVSKIRAEVQVPPTTTPSKLSPQLCRPSQTTLLDQARECIILQKKVVVHQEWVLALMKQRKHLEQKVKGTRCHKSLLSSAWFIAGTLLALVNMRLINQLRTSWNPSHLTVSAHLRGQLLHSLESLLESQVLLNTSLVELWQTLRQRHFYSELRVESLYPIKTIWVSQDLEAIPFHPSTSSLALLWALNSMTLQISLLQRIRLQDQVNMNKIPSHYLCLLHLTPWQGRTQDQIVEVGIMGLQGQARTR
jgi:hypothetical protein